ncbi:MAG: adenosine kinase [Bacteroidales bacterium]
MKSILGIGNALTDILAVLPDDSLLEKFYLPKGSMQHVDITTGNMIWEALKEMGIQYVPGGSAANTITGTAVFGMPSAFIGMVGVDDMGSLYKSDMKRNGIETKLFRGKAASGRAMVFITPPNSERTFADYMGAALELGPENLEPSLFEGYDYFHIEGYLVQNQKLLRRAVQLAQEAGMIISIDMASYNVVESNDSFLHDIVKNYVDIVFANELEAASYTKEQDPIKAITKISKQCDIAVVKVGAEGSYIMRGEEFHKVAACEADVKDVTGAGDLFASGFLYGYANDMPLDKCGEIGAIIAAKVVEVIGPKIDIPRWKEAKYLIKNMIREHHKKD